MNTLLSDIRPAEGHPVSVTGFWIMGAISTNVLKALRADIDVTQFEPIDSTADLGWWTEMDRAALPERGYRYAPDEPAVRFESGLDDLRPDDETRTQCVDALHETVDGGTFAVGTRKGDPYATLCYGLTFNAARRLPGRGGCFLLDPVEASTVLGSIGPILEHPPGGRAAFTERADTWCDVMTDAGGSADTLGLLDGPLKVLRRANETSSAVIAVTQWY